LIQFFADQPREQKTHHRTGKKKRAANRNGYGYQHKDQFLIHKTVSSSDLTVYLSFSLQRCQE
jgi:hypothetical protein